MGPFACPCTKEAEPPKPICPFVLCKRCGGTGIIKGPDTVANFAGELDEHCPFCRGVGVLGRKHWSLRDK